MKAMLIIPLLLSGILAGTAHGDVLTLDEALATALEHNRNLQNAEENLVQATLQVHRAWSNLLPRMGAQASQNWNNEVVTGFPITDPQQPAILGRPTQEGCVEPVPGDDPITPGPVCIFSEPAVQEVVVRPGQSQALSLSVSQPIFVASTIPAIRGANASREASEADFRAMQEQTLYHVAQLYMNTVALERLVHLQSQSYENMLRHQEVAQTRYELGEASRLSVLQAETEVARAEAAWHRSRVEYLNAMASLANLIGVERVGRLQPPEELTRFAGSDAPYEPYGEDATSVAREKRGDLMAARKQVVAARHARTAQSMRFAPTLMASAGLQWDTDPGAFGDARSWSVGLTLNLPLFEAGTRIHDRRESASRLRQAQTSLLSREQELRVELESAFNRMEVGRRTLTVARKQRALASESFAVAQTGFEHGAVSGMEVIDANQTLLGAEVEALREGLHVELDTLNYYRALGMLTDVLGVRPADGRSLP